MMGHGHEASACCTDNRLTLINIPVLTGITPHMCLIFEVYPCNPTRDLLVACTLDYENAKRGIR
jgi:hypothetical protein